MIRLPPLLLVPLLALLGCAQPQAEWVAMVPAEATLGIAERLPARRAEETTQRLSTNLLGRGEHWRYREGSVQVEQTYAGAKFSATMLQSYRDRAAGEGWSRNVMRTPAVTGLVAAEAVTHERFPGAGWLFTYATERPQIFCTVGRSYMAARGGHDDEGPLFDTALIASICHAGPDVPADMRALFRGLRPRAT